MFLLVPNTPAPITVAANATTYTAVRPGEQWEDQLEQARVRARRAGGARGDTCLTGLLDEVALYGYPLGAAQVEAHYLKAILGNRR